MKRIPKETRQRSIVNEVKNDIIQILTPEIKQAAIRKRNQEALKGTMHDFMLDVMKTMVIGELKEELKGELGIIGHRSVSEELTLHNGSRDLKEEAMERVNQKLNKINGNHLPVNSENVENISLDDLDEVDLATIKKLEAQGVRVIFPNLKYRKPKYNNMDSVLKYVESDKDDKSGVKLIIMNFND